MSYIETPGDFAYPWYVRLMLRRQRRRYGRELEPVRLWARMPGAFLAMSAMYRALDLKSSPVEPALRSLVQLRVSQINGCEFCVDLNSFLGSGRGLAQDKLREVPEFEDSPAFSEREKAALSYAETVTRSDRRVDEELIVRLRRHFDDQAIVELAALIAYQNMSAKFNAALGVPAHGFCGVLPHRVSSGRGTDPALALRYECSGVVLAPPERVFPHLDDHARLSSHMSESSWMMGGGRMQIELDADHGRKAGSRIRLAGRVLGIRLSVEEVVTERNPPRRKVWETTGVPKLLVIGRYRMGFELSPSGNDSVLRVFIEYALPAKAPARWLGRLLGGCYARWCARRMVEDAVKRFISPAPDAGAMAASDTQRRPR
jgi:AhpD family alkylhydroperoxidase